MVRSGKKTQCFDKKSHKIVIFKGESFASKNCKKTGDQENYKMEMLEVEKSSELQERFLQVKHFSDF